MYRKVVFKTKANPSRQHGAETRPFQNQKEKRPVGRPKKLNAKAAKISNIRHTETATIPTPAHTLKIGPTTTTSYEAPRDSSTPPQRVLAPSNELIQQPQPTATTNSHTKPIFTHTTFIHSYKPNNSNINGHQVRPNQPQKQSRKNKTAAFKDAVAVQKTQIPNEETKVPIK